MVDIDLHWENAERTARKRIHFLTLLLILIGQFSLMFPCSFIGCWICSCLECTYVRPSQSPHLSSINWSGAFKSIGSSTLEPHRSPRPHKRKQPMVLLHHVFSTFVLKLGVDKRAEYQHLSHFSIQHTGCRHTFLSLLCACSLLSLPPLHDRGYLKTSAMLK